MKEELISFETAKLAKEKEFDWDCTNYYQDSIRAGHFKVNSLKNSVIDFLHKEDESCVIYFTAPTQSLLQKWLRENYNFHFLIDTTPNCIEYRISIQNIKTLDLFHIDDRFKSYEEALEKGLEKALKLIK